MSDTITGITVFSSAVPDVHVIKGGGAMVRIGTPPTASLHFLSSDDAHAWAQSIVAQLASHRSAGQRALDRMADAALIGSKIPVELAANLALYHDGGIEWTFTLAPEGEPTRTEVDAIAQLVGTFGAPEVDSHSGVRERHHDLRWILDGDVTICGWGARDYVVAGSFRLPEGVAV